MNKPFILVLICLISFAGQAAELKTNPSPMPVKKSTSGVCHAPDSRFYARLKHFVTYETLKVCLDSGGRLPGKKSSKLK